LTLFYRTATISRLSDNPGVEMQITNAASDSKLLIETEQWLLLLAE